MGRTRYTGSCDLCSSCSTDRWYRKYIPDKVICRVCYQKERLKTGVGDKRRANNRNWTRSFKGAVKTAKQKGKTLELTEDQWNSKTKECNYCGLDISNNTGVRLDRVDNSKGYTNENTVGCCKQCNVAKNNHTLDNFKEWVDRVYKKFNI